MAFEHYIRSDGRDLRLGYTTGTCAALAAAGAAEGLLTGRIPEMLFLVTPKGLKVSVQPVNCEVEYKDDSSRIPRGRDKKPAAARCGVVKDAGDDLDVTDGLVIMAQARFWDDGEKAARVRRKDGGTALSDTGAEIRILGGAGIGRVTKPGLDQEVGEAAINRVPREMIRREVLRVCSEQGYRGGMTITLSVPGGEAAAAKTLNEQVGIVGGISIIGTSGIVEPMSRRAYADSVRLLIRQAAIEQGSVSGRGLILTPGNYGLSYLRHCGYDLVKKPIVVCSNFIGEALDEAAADGFNRILLIGHIGKLVKLAAGIMNTHSAVADGRVEIFTAHAAISGAGSGTCRRLMEAVTTDACIAILKEEGLDERVLGSILKKAQRYLDQRCPDAACGMIVFSNQYGELGRTARAVTILEEWNAEIEKR